MKNLFQTVYAWIVAHQDEDRGAAMVEYALLVALIAVVCIGAIAALGGKADSMFSAVSSQITG